MRVPWSQGEWQRVLVYGLGLSGRAAARLLLSRGVAVLAVDARPREALGELPDDPRLELLAGGEPATVPGEVDGVVVSPGVPMTRPLLADARRRGLPVIAEVELAFPFLNGPVLAITGSNGKSTTTALAGAMLRAAGFAVEVCGNIGEPLAGKVEGPPGRVFVVELSSFQIEGIVTFAPLAAALLNIAEDHLDRYPSLDDYAAAKKALFHGMGPQAFAVLNADDPQTTAIETRARRRLFSRLGPVADGCFADPADGQGRVLEVSPDGGGAVELFRAADVPLAGVQNLENAMAA
ncbi:MAG TPA: Mur ligase family protein, partial [Thermoanaerobaculia bacterium]|nr:Mur ligase family protein [Thermoanaerobaculia bacterium]